MNEVIDNILSRRSIRNYQEKDLPRDVLEQIIQAGLYAPSARNRQPWHLCVVIGRERIAPITAELKDAVERMPENPYKTFVNNPMYTVNFLAPVFIIVSGDPEQSNMVMADCTLVLQNIFLAARSLGVGSCWVNQLGSACNEPGFRAVLNGLGVPERNHVYGCAALGYPLGDWPSAPDRKSGLVNYVE